MLLNNEINKNKTTKIFNDYIICWTIFNSVKLERKIKLNAIKYTSMNILILFIIDLKLSKS